MKTSDPGKGYTISKKKAENRYSKSKYLVCDLITNHCYSRQHFCNPNKMVFQQQFSNSLWTPIQCPSFNLTLTTQSSAHSTVQGPPNWEQSEIGHPHVCHFCPACIPPSSSQHLYSPENHCRLSHCLWYWHSVEMPVKNFTCSTSDPAPW